MSDFAATQSSSTCSFSSSMKWMGIIRLRFLVEDPDVLFTEYRQRGVECSPIGIRDTPWGTREFALYDLDRNALTFYRHLTLREAVGLVAEDREHEANCGGR
jgi:hypothetical protein